jgi:IS5 family transposase
VHKRDEIVKAQANGAMNTEVQWSVVMKRATLKGMAEGPLKQLTQALEKVKSQIWARVDHPCHVVKNLFNHKKARNRNLAKNGAQYATLFARANLVIAKKPLSQSMENTVCEAV